MSISVTCQCGKTTKVKDKYAGKQGVCPFCGQVMDVPALPAARTTPAAPVVAPSPPPTTQPVRRPSSLNLGSVLDLDAVRLPPETSPSHQTPGFSLDGDLALADESTPLPVPRSAQPVNNKSANKNPAPSNTANNTPTTNKRNSLSLGLDLDLEDELLQPDSPPPGKPTNKLSLGSDRSVANDLGSRLEVELGLGVPDEDEIGLALSGLLGASGTSSLPDDSKPRTTTNPRNNNNQHEGAGQHADGSLHDDAGVHDSVVVRGAANSLGVATRDIPSSRGAASSLGDPSLLALASLHELSSLHSDANGDDSATSSITRERLEKLQRWEMARSIHRRLSAASPMQYGPFEIAGVCLPAPQVGGDYFDFITLQDGSLGVVLGDASGSGVNSAMMMSQFRLCMRTLALTYADVGTIFDLTNRVLQDELPPDVFATHCMARINQKTRQITFVGAGHPPAYVINASGKVQFELESSDMPLAVSDESSYATATPLRMGPGEALLMVSRGMVRAPTSDGKQFGIERLLDIVRANRRKPAEAILDIMHHVVRAANKNLPQVDDLTAVVILAK